MSLGTKTLLILTVIVTTYVAITIAIQQLVMFPSFVELERDEAEGDLRRVVQAIRAEIGHLGEHAHDWASWDDTYRFVAEPTREFVESNLVESAFASTRLNLIAFYDRSGARVWSKTVDYRDMTPLPGSEFDWPALPLGHPLLRGGGGGQSSALESETGVYVSQIGPMFVASRPIVDSAEERPPNGTLVMGRVITDDLVSALQARTDVSIRLWPYDSAAVPERARQGSHRLEAPGDYVAQEVDRDSLAVLTLLDDISGRPVLLLQGDVPRSITARGRTALRFGLVTVGVAGVALVLILLVLLRRSIISPLQELTDRAVEVGSQVDLQARAPSRRRDEIGHLAAELDRMVERLAAARKRLLDQSYYSGMAEMASGILHNVRNALSPVAVEIDTLRSGLDKARLDRLDRAYEELAQPHLAEERRRDLTEFVLVASKKLAKVAKLARERIDELLSRIDQIEQILDAQAEFGQVARPVELIRVRDLLEDTLAMLPRGLREHAEIRIDDTIDALQPIQTHRLQLMQVLANLLTNAVESTIEAKTRSPLVVVKGWLVEDDTSGTLHLTVEDNGTGIRPEIRARLFERGVSTKPDHHSGLGLHWCANTVRAMNGDLRVEDPGNHAGARFHLRIPALSASDA